MADSKGLPSDIDAERFVLGSILLDNRHHERCDLKDTDFSLDKHRSIYRSIQTLLSKNEVADTVTVADSLRVSGEIEKVGGVSYLVDLDTGTPRTENVEAWANKVRKKSQLRRMVYMARKVAAEAMSQEHDPEKILHDLGKAVARMEVKSGSRPKFLKPIDVIMGHEGGINGFLTNAVKPGLSTGLPQVDDLTNGLMPGSQMIIAGATHTGKSCLGSNIAVHVAESGNPMQIFALEMTKEQMIMRIIASIARVPIKGIIRNNLDREGRAKVNEAIDRIAEIPLYIDDTPELSIGELCVRVNRAVLEVGIKGYELDYLGLVNYQADKDLKLRTEYEGVTYASRACKLLSRRNNIFSIILSQLSRPADRRDPGKKPTLHELRSSGAIEQDADTIVMIYREELYKPGRPELRGKAELLVRKARMGETGTAEVTFQGKYTLFTDHGKPEEEAA